VATSSDKSTGGEAGEDRARARLLRHGAQALSSAELLAVLLRTGEADRTALDVAESLLKRFGGLRGLQRASARELSRVKLVGPVKAPHLAAGLELGRRAAAGAGDPPRTIHGPEDVADLLRNQLHKAKKEHFVVILLDTKNLVIDTVTVSVGSLDASLVHPREVFKEAILASAGGVIVAHNHPSGDLTPSLEDRQVTARLVDAGKLLGIELLDHVILADDRWVSLKRLGVM
jgi:DNA repair protein RadC